MENLNTYKLGDVGKFYRGRGISKSSISIDGKFKAIRYAELYTKYGIIIKDVYSHIGSEETKSSKQIMFGDILMAGSGEDLKDIGKSSVYALHEACYVGGDTLIFRPNTNQDGIFLGFLLNTRDFIKQRMKYGQGHSVVHIYADDLAKIKISLPPLPEQKQIVSIIEKWDKYIELLDKKIEIKKNTKKYLQQALLTGKVRLKGYEGEWEEYKLFALGNLYSGLQGKSKEDFGEGQKFISYMNIYSNPRVNINKEDLVSVKENESQNSAKYGDIFFTTSSETPDEVGISSVLLDHPMDKIYLNSFCFGYRLQNFETLSPEYAQFYFRSPSFRKKMNRIAQGAIRYNLSRKYFIEEKISLPPLPKQKAISSILTKSDKEIKTLEKQKQLIEQQRKYLINNLVTGNIRIPKFKNK